MSISKDEKFRMLLDKCRFSYYHFINGNNTLEDIEKSLKNLVDYIDEYSNKKYEEGIEDEKDMRKCCG